MKTGIHPEYYEVTVRCSCGHTFTTKSTKQNLRVDLCSNCHPFFTGDQRLVDTGGQVERFMRRLSRAKGGAAEAGEEQPTTSGAS
jgi:large subunit ribosomal protein L31